MNADNNKSNKYYNSYEFRHENGTHVRGLPGLPDDDKSICTHRHDNPSCGINNDIVDELPYATQPVGEVSYVWSPCNM